MMLEVLINKIKKLFLVVLGLIKRSLCCLRRRRRSSCESIPLTGVGVGAPFEAGLSAQNNDVENWAWEEPTGVVSDPNSVQHHIEMYRQQNVRGPPDKAEEAVPDFFEDMAPKISRQTKIKVRLQSHEEDSNAPSRLNFVPEAVPSVGPELGSWEEVEEGGGGSWEEAEAWDVSRLVRDKRRAEREKQAALKRELNRGILGSKVR